MRPSAAIFGPALVLMSGRALGFVASFAIPLVLARLFGQQEFGTYKQLFLIYSTLFGIVQVGMAESLYYFLPSESSHKGSYVLNVQLMLGALGAVALILLTWQQNTVVTLLNNSALQPYLALVGIYLLLMLSSLVLEIVMTAEKQLVAAAFAYALSDFFRAALFLIPVLALGGLRWMLWGAIVCALGRLAATVYYLRARYGNSLRPDLQLLGKQLQYALPFGLAGLIEVVQVNYHMYVVSWYFDAATFAIYSVGCLQLPLTDFLMTSTSNVMMVNMREQLQAGNQEAVHAIWLDAVRKLALILFPLVAVLLVLSHALIVLLFTESYARSTGVFMIWTLCMLLPTLLTDSLLRVHAENHFLIVQNCIRLALIALLIRPFLQQFDLIGAVLVTLLANCVAKVIALGRVKTLMGVGLAELLPWLSLGRTLLIATAAALPVLLVSANAGISSIPQLVLCGAAYTLTYYFLVLWYGPLHADEKQELVRWTQLPVARLCKAWKPGL